MISNEQQLSAAIEDVLVARNPRGMKTAQAALSPGYYLRAARYFQRAKGAVLIGTGFPVLDTFETDGPVGAIALYQTLETLGLQPWMVCAPPLSTIFENQGDYRVQVLKAQNLEAAQEEAESVLNQLQPDAVIAIERPGIAQDGRYYNMRGEDITARCAFFDPLMTQADCPTIAIGDGGNEIGMGNIANAIAQLDVTAASTCCDELLVADVSNWGAYGIIAFLGLWQGQDLLATISPPDILQFLSDNGSVDGVSRKNTLTEDGLDAAQGCQVISQLQQLVNQYNFTGNTISS